MKLKVLVIGAGMYVCGRGTDAFGTVLPSLYEAYRSGLIESVCVVATSSSSTKAVERKNKELSLRMGFALPLKGFAMAGSGADMYKQAEGISPGLCHRGRSGSCARKRGQYCCQERRACLGG
jgi:hypothetical protein